MRINPPLVALAMGAFGIGVTEFAPMGMLPSIAADLGVSIPAAGLLVSAYALGVLLGAPLMTLTTGRIPRRYLLIGLMAIFTLGNLMSALATIGGVPLAAWFGELFGWRTAFWGITGLGVVAMAALWFALPNLKTPPSVGVMAEIRVLGRGPVLGALALTVVGSGAMFTVFTYIAPILSSETHASSAYITAMLVLFGVGLTLGNMWGGKAADHSIDRTLIVSLSVLILVLLAFTVLMRWPLPAAVAILIWGIASFALVPPLQMRVMEAAKDAPNLASAVNIGAFNFGNAIGAALGGAVINAGLGYPAISLAGAAMAGLGLLMVLAFAWRSRTVATTLVSR